MHRMLPRRPPDWILVLLLIAGVYLWQRTVFPLWMIDILPFQVASWQWKHGETEWMYTTAERLSEWTEHSKLISEQLGGEGFGNPYFYPPFVAAALSPFCEAPPAWWRDILFAINIALIFVNVWIVLRVCRVVVSMRSFLWALALVLLAYPMARATHLGQIVPILAVLSWTAILLLQSHRVRLSAVILGVVSALKVFPAGLLLLPVITKRWRHTAVWLGTAVALYGASLLALGTEIHQRWWQAVCQFGSRVYPYVGNQALIGWYSRLFRHRDLMECVPYTDSGLVVARNVIALLVGGVTVLILIRNRRRITDERLPVFFGFLFAGILLAIANAWEHYWLFCLPVLGWAVREAWQEGRIGLSQFWIAAASFFFLMKLTRFYVDSPLGRLASGSQTVGMLMLWLWLAWWIERERRLKVAA